MHSQELPTSLLLRARELPVKPDPIILQGTFVSLEPLNVAAHSETLFRISNGDEFTLGDKTHPAYDPDEKIWRYMNSGPFESLEIFTQYLQASIDAPDTLPFCVRDNITRYPIGCACLMANMPQHLKIEIGGIWYSPIAQGTKANTEATYLLLEHVFSLGYRRAEWKCNALNLRSRRAAERIGFTFEGIQEAHYIVKGRNRNTAWFRILTQEWHSIKTNLRKILYDRA